jgi:hypothetical protein
VNRGFVLQVGDTRRPISLTEVDTKHGTPFCSIVEGEDTVQLTEASLAVLLLRGTLLELRDGHVRPARVELEAGNLVFAEVPTLSVNEAASSGNYFLWSDLS